MHRSLLAVGTGALALGNVFASMSGPAGAAGTASEADGAIKLCVTGGGPLSVFADGPELRTATLTNKCKAFEVKPGQYYVGIQGYAVPDNCSLNGATVKRGKYVYRAPEVLFTHVVPTKLTKVTFALDCSLPNK
ncbi:hypothetical protein [Sporichthya sp.]|uniref:hypothetical protein n=1 Tax=Sporichthya sp. TaxID=65475 RepID=UPI0025FB7819|nr:hypothetical protein [Sporichthya sp.]